MRYEHVAKGAGALVEAPAHFDRKSLRDVDLDVIDVVAVPDRLEHAVGEAQRQQVLHRLAPEVVVDPVDPVLLEDRVQPFVQLVGGGEVGAKGFSVITRASSPILSLPISSTVPCAAFGGSER